MTCDQFRREVQEIVEELPEIEVKADLPLRVSVQFSPEAAEHVCECESCVEFAASVGQTQSEPLAA